MVDLYYELYGRKKPVSVPLPELAALRPQKVEKPKGGDKDGGGGGKVRDSSREIGRDRPTSVTRRARKYVSLLTFAQGCQWSRS